MPISVEILPEAQRMLDEADERWVTDRELIEILAVWFAKRGSGPPL